MSKEWTTPTNEVSRSLATVSPCKLETTLALQSPPLLTHVQTWMCHTSACVCPLVRSQTKYRPNEIQKWKMMCHPNLLPLLALQYYFQPVGPVEKCAVEASCWAFMPVMDGECVLWRTAVWCERGLRGYCQYSERRGCTCGAVGMGSVWSDVVMWPFMVTV